MSSYFHSILSLTFIAEADLSAARYRLVIPGTADRSMVLPSSDGDLVLGALDGKPANGKPGTVILAGVAEVEAGDGGVTYGAKVMAEATTGKGIAFTGSGVHVAGTALADAAADERFPLLLAASGGSFLSP